MRFSFHERNERYYICTSHEDKLLAACDRILGLQLKRPGASRKIRHILVFLCLWPGPRTILCLLNILKNSTGRLWKNWFWLWIERGNNPLHFFEGIFILPVWNICWSFLRVKYWPIWILLIFFKAKEILKTICASRAMCLPRSCR
jgi:hypothetical protein